MCPRSLFSVLPPSATRRSACVRGCLLALPLLGLSLADAAENATPAAVPSRPAAGGSEAAEPSTTDIAASRPRWLEEVRAQRLALQAQRRAQQEAREEAFQRRRQERREQFEADRWLFLNEGPWMNSPMNRPGSPPVSPPLNAPIGPTAPPAGLQGATDPVTGLPVPDPALNTLPSPASGQAGGSAPDPAAGPASGTGSRIPPDWNNGWYFRGW
ncbi:hypothetical protein F2Q65_10790 [Thiohalocapsa marina]|uniref:DUF3106 domain-containing protein n=1 Tax=Thiohalocapsa marina TaxID=424902 RepID=A0A5M8FQK1_9GAMM|nr:hypothetical protein [Thiohalocapsa marina]KAA6184795.1 hypothetical protein F2Q65_10790 [Thiohalocapsa marina]